MWNWSIDEKTFKKKHPKEYRLWRLTQLINYGLDKDEKINRKELIENWDKIKDDLDQNKAIYMKFLLWNQKPSSREFTENFWRP